MRICILMEKLVCRNATNKRELYDVNRNAYGHDGVVYFYSDVKYDGKDTLNMYKDGKVTVVSDSVHDFTILEDGRVLYLGDYDTDRKQGTLYIFDGKKSVEVEKNVNAVIFTYSDNIFKTGIA